MRQLLLSTALMLLGPQALGAELVPGEVIVRWRTAPPRDAVRAHVRSILPRASVRTRKLWDTTEVLEVGGASAAETRALIASLSARRDVAYAEPNLIRRPFALPNDPHYPVQWGLPRAGLEAAWDLTKGSAAVVVAFVDTGVRPDHPDLAGRLLRGYDFISNATRAGDGDGRDDDPTDVGSSEVGGSVQHGLHVAGIIGAASNNGVGISGVDWACRLLPVRALGVDEGSGNDADISAAIRWAAGLSVNGVPNNEDPADVINLSFGGEGKTTTLESAVRDAVAAGAVVVTAAGNDGVDGSSTYPAAFPGVLNVGALGYDDGIASYSNFGAKVSLMAPGGDMLLDLPFEHQGQTLPAGIVSTMYDTTAPNNPFGYRMYDGTSQAAPVVSGIAALVLAANPNLKASDVKNILVNNADPGGKCNEGCGAGSVDAYAAVKAALDLVPQPPPNPGDGLPFGSACVDDTECASRTCRDLGSGPICTLTCTAAKTACPESSVCDHGFCAPNSRTPSASRPDDPELIGGCALGGRRAPSAWLLPLLLLVVALVRRRR